MEFYHLSSCQEDLFVLQILSLFPGAPLNNTFMVHQHLRCQGRAFNNYVDNKMGEGVSRMSTVGQQIVHRGKITGDKG